MSRGSSIITYAFANKIGQRVSTSFLDPYDAYKQKFSLRRDLRDIDESDIDESQNKHLSLIVDKRVVYILDTNKISVRWSLECAKSILEYQPNNFAIELLQAVSLWLDTGILEYNILMIADLCDYYSAAAAAYSAYYASISKELLSAYCAYLSSTHTYETSEEMNWQIPQQRKILQSIINRSFMLNLLTKKVPNDLLSKIGTYL